MLIDVLGQKRLQVETNGELHMVVDFASDASHRIVLEPIVVDNQERWSIFDEKLLVTLGTAMTLSANVIIQWMRERVYCPNDSSKVSEVTGRLRLSKTSSLSLYFPQV